MAIDEFGKSVPSLTPLDDDAAALLEGFGAEIQARESKAHGTLKSAMGKARGQALRLALVLEYLWWCPHETRMEPVSISSEAMQAAIRLMTDYFLPMAARVLGAA